VLKSHFKYTAKVEATRNAKTAKCQFDLSSFEASSLVSTVIGGVSLTIRFGTDGWRGVMGRDFTVEGVKLVAQAISDYVCSRGLAKRGVVVGYDARMNSEEYADACIEVLAGNGITAYKTSRDTPTPVVAFAATRLRAAGAIMITASHNPAEYNGIKFIPHYGGPALPDVTSEIEGLIGKTKPATTSIREADRRGLLALVDFKEEYSEWALSLVDVDAIKRSSLRVLVDPLYGSTRGYLEDILRAAGCQVSSIHSDRNPGFGGLTPDPTTPESLRELANSMSGFDLGLACDGDGDRVAAYSESFFSPNNIFPLVLLHLIELGVKGGVVRTVATTHMVDAVDDQYGLKLYEVPVGFKNIVPHLIMGEAVMGGEESGGFGYKWHIPEKDGILSCLYIVEALALSGKRRLEDLQADFKRSFKLLHSVRGSIRVERPERFKMTLLKKEFSDVAGYEVLETVRIDGVKLITSEGWLLMRPSGTEPLVRVYSESPSLDVAKLMLEWGLKRAEEISRSC